MENHQAYKLNAIKIVVIMEKSFANALKIAKKKANMTEMRHNS